MATRERRNANRGQETGAKDGKAVEPSMGGNDAPAQAPAGRPRLPADEDRRREEIAKEAYYNAERRGFDGNRELDDWLEAEKAIDSRAAGRGIQHEAAVLSEGTADASDPASAQNRTADAAWETIEPSDVQKWAKKLKVTAPRVREAIQRVGPAARDVQRYLAADGKA